MSGLTNYFLFLLFNQVSICFVDLSWFISDIEELVRAKLNSATSGETLILSLPPTTGERICTIKRKNGPEIKLDERKAIQGERTELAEVCMGTNEKQ